MEINTETRQSEERITALVDQAKDIRKKIDAMPAFPETPIEVSMLINYYIDVQAIVGELMSMANFEFIFWEHDRKYKMASYREGLHGYTVKDADAQCNLHTAEERKKEKVFGAQRYKWETYNKNLENKANALKKHLDVVLLDFNNGNRRRQSGG